VGGDATVPVGVDVGEGGAGEKGWGAFRSTRIQQRKRQIEVKWPVSLRELEARLKDALKNSLPPPLQL